MCLEMSHIFQCAPNIYQNLLQMCIPRLSFMFHVYNSTWKKVNIMLRLPEIGCLPLCCVPTSFPYGSNQLHSLAGPNAFTQMNALQYCLASLLDIHQLMLLFTTFSTACGRDLTISRLINVTVKANHQKVNLLATSLQILTKITLPPSLSISKSIRPAAS